MIRNTRIVQAAAALVFASGLAQAQINITSQTRFVEAVAGNGSGTSHFDCLNFNAWNQQASKSWPNSSNSIRQISSMSAWTMDTNMTGTNFAPTDGEAGNISSRYRVEFSISQPMDVYAQGGFSGDDTSGAQQRIWNRNTNATVFGGSGNFYQHLTPGIYAFEQSINSFARGQINGDMAIQFRPGNDTCEYATVVTNNSYTGTTVAASGSGDGPAACNTPAFPDAVWFKYTAPRSGPLTLTTCGSSFDTVLTVFNNGNCNLSAGNITACNDDAPLGSGCASGTTRSSLTLNVNTGEQFLIRLSGYNDATGDYRLNVGPVNDKCDSMIPAVIGNNAFDNRMADTDGAVLNSCVISGDNQVNGDLWYSFIPTEDGLLTVSTCTGTDWDTKLAVYNGYSCGVNGLMACNDDFCGLRSQIEDLQVVAGQWYTIRVGGFTTARGIGNLNLAFAGYCSADFNHDGVVDFFDYLDFVDAFAASAPAADFNDDSVIDFFDYLDFVDAFSAGC